MIVTTLPSAGLVHLFLEPVAAKNPSIDSLSTKSARWTGLAGLNYRGTGSLHVKLNKKSFADL